MDIKEGVKIFIKFLWCLVMTPILILITIFTASFDTWTNFLRQVWKEY